MSEAERDELFEQARPVGAGVAVMTREAFAQAGAALRGAARSSCRRSAMRRDAKAIADLQGRIAAEQAMLENEQAKLATLLTQAARGGAAGCRRGELRELAIAGHGEFETRLHPLLP